MNLTLEPLAPGDASSLLCIAERAIEAQVLPILLELGRETMRKATRSSVAQVEGTARHLTLKALSGTRIVGFVDWRDGDYITQLYVDPPLKGGGRFRLDTRTEGAAEKWVSSTDAGICQCRRLP